LEEECSNLAALRGVHGCMSLPQSKYAGDLDTVNGTCLRADEIISQTSQQPLEDDRQSIYTQFNGPTECRDLYVTVLAGVRT